MVQRDVELHRLDEPCWRTVIFETYGGRLIGTHRDRPGIPGTAAVAKAVPDGYTLMLTSNGHTIGRAISKSAQYDPVKDFAGVTQVASVPLVAIVPPDFPAGTIADFIALAKTRPGKL